MSQLIKVLTVSDIHRSTRLYEALKAAVGKHRPDIVAVVGDFLDATGAAAGKLRTEECARFLSRLPCAEMVFVRGNHEDSSWFQFAEEWRQSGKELHMLDGQTFVYGPLVIVGFPCLMLHGDGIFDNVPVDPEKWLPPLIRPFGPAGRTLWLMHEPPYGTSLSQSNGPLSGNMEWTVAVERFLPWLVVCGHDHHTPIKTKRWTHQVGPSLCINVGQTVDGPLHYCLIEMEFNQAGPCLPRKVKVTNYPTGGSVMLPFKL